MIIAVRVETSGRLQNSAYGLFRPFFSFISACVEKRLRLLSQKYFFQAFQAIGGKEFITKLRRFFSSSRYVKGCILFIFGLWLNAAEDGKKDKQDGLFFDRNCLMSRRIEWMQMIDKLDGNAADRPLLKKTNMTRRPSKDMM